VVTVDYKHQIEYAYDRSGKRFPQLSFRISSTSDLKRAMDVNTYLDSGSERSLFNGWIGSVLGIDILSGPRMTFESAAGSYLTTTIHPVRLVHDDMGTFEIEVGFSTSEISRNLLGRDFFDLVQIGFREHQLCFFVTPEP
jgi:hypothetical protein